MTIENQRNGRIKYTQDQTTALTEIDAFLKVPSKAYEADINTFKLAGYAGTGKTTIIENIFTYARDVLGLDVYISAPTNAAVKVLRQKSNDWKANFINYKDKFRTLHSLLYGEPDDNGNWYAKCSFGSGQLVIIDESSMIDTFVNNDINKHITNRGAKVIKIGDGFQLEPVGSDPKVLNNPHVEMKDVQRHDGVVLDYVTKIREIKKSCVPNESRGDVCVLPIDIVGENWLKDVKKDTNCIFITGTNKTRIALNKLARFTKFGENPDVLKETDRMIVIANSDSFKNSETFTVTGIIDIKPINIYSVKGETFGDCYYAKVKIDYMEKEILMFPETARPSIYHPEIDIKTIPYNLRHIIETKFKRPAIKRQVLITTYGYAITAHKAQGSQWDNVYVHNDFWKDNPRWLYTAASRTTKMLTISDTSSSNKLNWTQIIGES